MYIIFLHYKQMQFQKKTKRLFGHFTLYKIAILLFNVFKDRDDVFFLIFLEKKLYE